MCFSSLFFFSHLKCMKFFQWKLSFKLKPELELIAVMKQSKQKGSDYQMSFRDQISINQAFGEMLLGLG